MISLHPNEQIMLTLHRHWVVLAGRMVLLALLALVPVFLFPFYSTLLFFIVPGSQFVFFLFLASIYWLVVLLFFFIEWLDYWLDVWIVTSERILDIEQRGLFWRRASEFMIDRCQDVTIETPGFFATFFKYGNITVQTAGEVSFTAYTVAHPDHAKKIILSCADERHKIIASRL